MTRLEPIPEQRVAGLVSLADQRFAEIVKTSRLDIWSMSGTIREIGDRREKEINP